MVLVLVTVAVTFTGVPTGGAVFESVILEIAGCTLVKSD
jgi:hypothetical protein